MSDEMRNEFEKWVRDFGEFDLYPAGPDCGTYAALDTEDMWKTWQAARRSQRERDARAICQWCRDDAPLREGKHIFKMCRCGHGKNYHRPTCHAQCNCREFMEGIGVSPERCLAEAIRAQSDSEGKP